MTFKLYHALTAVSLLIVCQRSFATLSCNAAFGLNSYPAIKSGYADIKNVASFLGINGTPSFYTQDIPTQVNQITLTIRNVLKLSPGILYRLMLRNKKIDLVLSSVTEHPDMHRLKGVRPRGWPEGSTWDQVPAMSFQLGPVVIAPSRFVKGSGHGSDNMILHELGHAIDDTLVTKSGNRMKSISSASAWTRIYAKYKWDDYGSSHIREAFAMTIEFYFHSPELRAEVERNTPDAHRLVSRLSQSLDRKTPPNFLKFYDELKEFTKDSSSVY